MIAIYTNTRMRILKVNKRQYDGTLLYIFLDTVGFKANHQYFSYFSSQSIRVVGDEDQSHP